MKLVRLSEDGTHLVLAHEGTGEEFALRIDDRVRGAVVSDRARIGQLPVERPSRLRPKEIQARLRAGESSEDIAAAADVPLERILRYAGPVLAEREYIAEQARRCALRRQPGGTAGKTLEQVAGDRLESLGLDLERSEWDAWRAPDGRWAVSVTYSFDGQQQRAVFSYDPLGRLVVPSDDAAREMVEGPKEPVPSAAGPAVVHGPGPRTPRDGRLRLAPLPAPEASPEVYAGDPDTGRSADIRQLRPAPAAPPQPVQPAAHERDDLSDLDLDAIDSEDTVDLSRTLGRNPGQLKPVQRLAPPEPEPEPELEPELEPEPEPVLRSEPRREPEPPRQPEPAPEMLPDLLDLPTQPPTAERRSEPTPAPAPPPADDNWLPEPLPEEGEAEQPPVVEAPAEAPVVEERPVTQRPVPAPPKQPVPAPPPSRKPAPAREAAKEQPVVERPVKEQPAKPAAEKPVKPAPEPEAEPAEVVAEVAAEPEPAPEPEPETERSVRRPKPANAGAQRKRAARSSRKGAVPSWDDILFGGGKK